MSLFPATVISSEERAVEAQLDLDRVLSLPRREPLDCMRRGNEYASEAVALAEYVTEKFSLGSRVCKCRELGYAKCITQLNPVQAWSLRELSRCGGVLGLLPVASGKTITSLLAALALPNVKVAVLLAKPDQRLHYRNAYLRLREHFRVPSIIFDDVASGSYLVRGAPSVHFVPYSRLSRPDATDLLEQRSPDLIICDEVHSVSARTSSRTMRLLRFLAAKDGVRFCGWSGTVIKKSVRDVAHLAAHALGMGSPLPLDPDEVDAWAAVLDPLPNPDRGSQVARRLYAAFDSRTDLDRNHWGSNAAAWRGYYDRIVRTPGVVSTKETSISASVVFHERPAPKLPKAVRDALVMTRRGERPDGDILEDALRVADCVREVACGFFHYWKFRVEDSDDLIDEWFRRRKAFYKALRAKLLLGEVHLDSKKLCENAAARFWSKSVRCGHANELGWQCERDSGHRGDCEHLPRWACEEWPAWAEIEDKVPHEERVRWIGHGMPEADDPTTHPGYFLARDAAIWAKEHRGIVWVQSVALGHKIAELADVNWHGGGPSAEERILAENGKLSIVASMNAHGESRDGLQHKYAEQLVVEPPSSGDRWEQLLGRLNRPGQEADEVHTWVYRHVSEFRGALRSALRRAEFCGAQLLLAADDADGVFEGDDE